MTDTQFATIVSLLERIAAAVEAREEPDRAAQLLAAIHRHVGDAEFTSSELVQHASLPQAVALHAAIVREFGDTNPRRIGKWLHAIEGGEIAGFRVQRIGDERAGAIWILRVCRPNPPAALQTNGSPSMLCALSTKE